MKISDIVLNNADPFLDEMNNRFLVTKKEDEMN